MVLFLALVLTGCRDNPDRHLQLGNWYVQKGLLGEAILEFKEVIRLYPTDPSELSREDYQALSQAHYNLSLIYTKKEWWDVALKEAQISFDLQPTKDHYELIQLIKKRAALEEPAAGS
ncbi:MAG: hypothetical protein D6762_00325 [Candidatus Neomarinimicrobiota bacterium]|nr:MAG: hypothetical protein D6762_00325 [Candidatus Neomarinimicrobiota bacterium]